MLKLQRTQLPIYTLFSDNLQNQYIVDAESKIIFLMSNFECFAGMRQVDPRVWKVSRPLVQTQVQAKRTETREEAKREEGEEGEDEERAQNEGKS